MSGKLVYLYNQAVGRISPNKPLTRMLDGSRVRVDAVAGLVLVTQQSAQFVVLGLCSVMVIDTDRLHKCQKGMLMVS